jgi:DNA-binding response OmpR family regulator
MGESSELVLDTIRMAIEGPLEKVFLSPEETEALLMLVNGRSVGAPKGDLESLYRLQLAGPFALPMRISRLRKKLRAAGADERCIVAARTGTYRLCCPLRVLDASTASG